MSTKYVQTRSSGAANEWTGDDCGVGYDKADDRFYINPDGTRRMVKTIGASAGEVVTATNVITALENGKTFYLNAVAGFLSTLPAPAVGLNYRFIVKTAPTSNGYTIGTNGGSNVIFGMAVERAGGAGVAGSAEDLITLVANQSIPGDFVYVESDGTNWYAYAMVDVSAGITFTVT